MIYNIPYNISLPLSLSFPLSLLCLMCVKAFLFYALKGNTISAIAAIKHIVTIWKLDVLCRNAKNEFRLENSLRMELIWCKWLWQHGEALKSQCHLQNLWWKYSYAVFCKRLNCLIDEY